MKYLGMDLGTKTLGLAISDKLGIIASPYKTLHYKDMEELVSLVLEVIKEEKIEELVLGYPKNMNNTEGEAIERTKRFLNMLKNSTSLEIHLIDERLSTVEAENILLKEDMRRDKRKKIIDSIAASIILATYLKRIERK